MTGSLVRRSETAILEIDQIFLYLAQHDLRAAESFILRVEAALTLISDHPRIGRERDEWDGIRGYSVPPYILIYRLDVISRIVSLERVLDGRQDLRKALGL